jgi:hypothetical protein
MEPPAGGELPAVIAPHDSHRTWFACADVERNGVDLADPVVAAVKLATGATLRSKPRRLAPRSRRGPLRR